MTIIKGIEEEVLINRLIYKVEAERIKIISCRWHYS